MSVNQQNYEIIDDREKVEYDRFWMVRDNEYFLDEEGDLYVKLGGNYFLDPEYNDNPTYPEIDPHEGLCNAFCLNDNLLAEFKSDEKVVRLKGVEIRYK